MRTLENNGDFECNLGSKAGQAFICRVYGGSDGFCLIGAVKFALFSFFRERKAPILWDVPPSTAGLRHLVLL